MDPKGPNWMISHFIKYWLKFYLNHLSFHSERFKICNTLKNTTVIYLFISVNIYWVSSHCQALFKVLDKGKTVIVVNRKINMTWSPSLKSSN